MARSILNSAEYQAAHPTTRSLVTALYNDVLGRQVDPDSQTDFATAVTTGTTPTGIVGMFVDSAEAHDQAVESFYAAFLHRPLESGPSAAVWTDRLDSGTDSLSDLAIGILSSDEYLQDALAGRS